MLDHKWPHLFHIYFRWTHKHRVSKLTLCEWLCVKSLLVCSWPCACVCGCVWVRVCVCVKLKYTQWLSLQYATLHTVCKMPTNRYPKKTSPRYLLGVCKASKLWLDTSCTQKPFPRIGKFACICITWQTSLSEDHWLHFHRTCGRATKDTLRTDGSAERDPKGTQCACFCCVCTSSSPY